MQKQAVPHRLPTLFALALSCLLAWNAVAEPGPPDHHGPPPDGHGIEAYAEQLGLSSEVRAQIDQIVERSRKQNQDLRRELRRAHRTLRGLLDQGDTVDEAAVMAQANVIGEIETRRHRNRLQAMLDIRRLLTTEQREELVRLRQGDHEDGRGWRDRGERMRHGMRSCRDDRQRLCPEAVDGRSKLECFTENWDALSETCQRAFDSPGRKAGGPPL